MFPARLLLLGAATALAPFALAAQDAPGPAVTLVGVDLAAKLKAGSPFGLRSALAEALLARDAKDTPDTLLRDPEYRRALAAHEVLRVTGDKAVSDFLTSRKDAAAFLAVFLSNTDWMEAYLAAGRVPAGTSVGLGVLADIWKSEARHPKFADYHHLSAALASVWGAGTLGDHYVRGSARTGISNLSPVWRYRFFRDRHLAGRLQPAFGQLKSWELHLVVGTKFEDASIAWLNDNVNVPAHRYTDACWLPTYRGASDFGDHVQGPLFYRPWRTFMSTAETIKVHGGVCGSLSHFGAYAAAAHGLPAMTLGQPGHCAYAVRLARGDWRGGFGGPDGWPHIAIWPGNIHHTLLMEKVFGDDDALRTALAHAARPRLFAAAGDLRQAEAALDAALRASPCHRDLHLEKIALLQSRTDAAYWRTYAESLLPTLAPFGAAGRPILASASAKFLASADDTSALAWFAQENAAYSLAPDSWAWAFDDEVLDRQAAALRAPASRERLFRDTLAAQFASAKKPQLGKVIDWGVKKLLEKGEADAFGRAFADAAGGATTKGDDKPLRDAYAKAIVGVEKARSLSGFQALGKAAAKYAEAPEPLKPDLPPGRLVSDRGALRLSSYDWDQPLTHFNTLNLTGGVFHTASEAAPHAIVTLPESVELAGLLVIKTEGHQYRMKKMRAYRSVDGETWFPIAEVADMPRQWRIECPPGTPARWIKIESLPESPEHLHLRNILVFAR